MPVQEQKMERTMVSLPAKQLEKIDRRVKDGEYPSRAEFFRNAVREFDKNHPAPSGEAA